MASNRVDEPKVDGAGEPFPSYQKPDDLPINHGHQEGRDEESLPDMKETEVLDAYGNEEGAEVKCNVLHFVCT